MMAYRQADPRFPFLWESAQQPPARWHGVGEGPVQYFADTPDGAWAEFLRHEGITQASELANIRRTLWVVELPGDLEMQAPRLPVAALTGGLETYDECQRESRWLRAAGAKAIRAPSAALVPKGARTWRVDGGLRVADQIDGTVVALFGARPDLKGWMAADEATPGSDLLARVRRLEYR